MQVNRRQNEIQLKSSGCTLVFHWFEQLMKNEVGVLCVWQMTGNSILFRVKVFEIISVTSRTWRGIPIENLNSPSLMRPEWYVKILFKPDGTYLRVLLRTSFFDHVVLQNLRNFIVPFFGCFLHRYTSYHISVV